jgi:hypothetical protein
MRGRGMAGAVPLLEQASALLGQVVVGRELNVGYRGDHGVFGAVGSDGVGADGSEADEFLVAAVDGLPHDG